MQISSVNLGAAPPDGQDAQLEVRRIHALRSTKLIDTCGSENFDRITRLAAALFGVPIALISLIDTKRQWFKSCVGLVASESAREVAFCDYTIRSADVMVVEDATLDPRFANNPLVTGAPCIRFYAGAPLILKSGEALGSLCIIDHVPRSINQSQRGQLQDLAAVVMTQIDLHRAAGRLDDLTQLPNHSQLFEDFNDLARASPGEERVLLLIQAMDPDSMRDTARAIGIATVEESLKNLTVTLQQILDEKSTLYYVGMGRFVVLTALQADSLERFIDRLEKLLKQPVTSGDLLVELDASIGVVQVELKPQEIQEALRKAMTALHRARTSGRFRMTYEHEFDITHQRAYSILQDLPRAIASESELHLVFQPKLQVSSGTFNGVEALLRWNHPQLGAIPPSIFIPLAENTTLIHHLMSWVLDAAMREIVKLSARGLAITVAVNVSARNLERPDFVDDLVRTLARHSIMPARLHIECTEYSRLTDPVIMGVLLKIRALGIQLSLDDFGIGYSNLTCLETLPFQLLKVDQSLVSPITKNPRARRLLEGVVSLGHGMGFRMLAEGVETAETFQHVVDLGFDHVQGYYLSRPLCSDALVAFLENPPSLDTFKKPVLET